jgi:hypothetical protein
LRVGGSDIPNTLEEEKERSKGGRVTLPTQKQSRATAEVTPLSARVLLAGMPGSGKTTLAAGWAPETTLILDTHRGTTLLDGEHYVEHLTSWGQFTRIVSELTSTEHKFKTVVIDLVEDLWRYCDEAHAGKNAVSGSTTEDYNRSFKIAELMFYRVLGHLMNSPLGVWLICHTEDVKDDKIVRYRPKLDKKVYTWTVGACQFGFLAETLGPKRVLHTAPSAKFEAKSRVALPEPMELDARKLYAAMDRGLKTEAAKSATQNIEKTEPEKVAA